MKRGKKRRFNKNRKKTNREEDEHQDEYVNKTPRGVNSKNIAQSKGKSTVNVSTSGSTKQYSNYTLNKNLKNIGVESSKGAYQSGSGGQITSFEKESNTDKGK